MADTLTDLVGAISPIVDALYGSAVEQVVGRRKAELHGRPPRVAWVPLEEENDPPRRAGGNPRSLGTRRLRCSVRIWGSTFETLESLHRAVLVATHRVAHGSLTWGGATWPETTGEMTTLGELVDQRIEFHMPVTDSTVATATVTTAEHTTGLEDSLEDCDHPT